MADNRLEQIVDFVQTQGFASVKELSELYSVSEVTIRRDLQRLYEEDRLRRTYGGAASLLPPTAPDVDAGDGQPIHPEAGVFVADKMDVLIAPSFDPRADEILFDRAKRKNIPVIAESSDMPGNTTLVALDNYEAGVALGAWAGHYAQRHFDGQAVVLDLTYHWQNTQVRSKGFITGLRDVLPTAQMALSINAQSAAQTAYQLTTDALQVSPEINIIFAINDSTAWGAIQACRAQGIAPDAILVIPFGLEGDALKDVLLAGEYCKVGLAMFPEIVAPVCIEAAILAYDRQPLPPKLTTPFELLTPESLLDFYSRNEVGWQLKRDVLRDRLKSPLTIDKTKLMQHENLPQRIGFIVPHLDHEWYRNLIMFMQEHLDETAIVLHTIGADQSLRDEVALRKRSIAETAVSQVKPGDVLLIDHGQINIYLAEQLAVKTKEPITVITNSLPIFEILRNKPAITLILTGGVMPDGSDILVGPTVESSLKGLRADKLFLSVSGVSLDFGLSHTNLVEVAIKQAMIHAAHEVILLADHTKFEQESVIQVAPNTAVNKLITDNALPASTRLELSKQQIEVILAEERAQG